MMLFSDAKIHINTINARIKKNNNAIISIMAEISNLEQLTTIIEKIKEIQEVVDVHRVTPNKVNLH